LEEGLKIEDELLDIEEIEVNEFSSKRKKNGDKKEKIVKEKSGKKAIAVEKKQIFIEEKKKYKEERDSLKEKLKLLKKNHKKK